MLSIALHDKTVNIKRAGMDALEQIVIDVIKTNNPKKIEVIDYYFKKFKFKPHKKLNNEMSFVECAMKYDFDLLCKYITNLDIVAPNYNIINVCVANNKVDLLKKYIKGKNIHPEQSIDDDTPLTLSIKKRNYQCFKILLDNNCSIFTLTGNNLSPFSVLLTEINNGYDLDNITDADLEFFKYALHRLLPIKITRTILYSEDEYNMLFDPARMLDSTLFKSVVNGYPDDVDEVGDCQLHFIRNNMLFWMYEINIFITLVRHDKYNLAKEIIARRPYILLTHYGTEYLLIHLYNIANTELLDYITENLNGMIYYENVKLVHFLAQQNKSVYAQKILHAYPDKIHEIDGSGRTLLESVLLSTSMTDEERILFFDKLVDLGVDPNHVNDFGTCCLTIAIQYLSDNVFAHLVKYFDKDTTPTDPIIYACSFEQFNKFKILVDNDFNIMTLTCHNVTIPCCIKNALNINNYEMVKYIISNPKFGITEDIMPFIFKIARRHKCSNKILKLFDNTISDDEIDPLTAETLRMNGLFANFCQPYFSNERNIICCAKIIILMFLKIIDTEPNKMCKYGFFNQEEIFIKENSYMQNLRFVGKIMMAIILHQKMSNVYPANLIHVYETVYEDNIYESVMIHHKKFLMEYKSKFEALSIIFDELFLFVIKTSDNEMCDSSDDEYSDDDFDDEHYETFEFKKLLNIKRKHKIDIRKYKKKSNVDEQKKKKRVSEHKNHEPIVLTDSDERPPSPIIEPIEPVLPIIMTTSLTEEKINLMLSRIMYPFKLANHHILHEQLSGSSIFCDEGNKFRFYANDKPVALIYKKNKSEIPCWIKHYGYNICIENKLDENHMFPFAIDIFLHQMWENDDRLIQCGYHKSDTATCIYFYGKYLKNDRWIRGYYEYFLNDKNILFHRLFKPLS